MGEIRMHGRGGQGTVMAAEMLANAFVLEGKYASVFPSFGIERSGSMVEAYARFSDSEIREKTRVYDPEYLIVLEPSLLSKNVIYKGFLANGTIITCGRDVNQIVEAGAKPARVGLVDGIKIALEETGTNITNVIMLGAFAKATGLVSLESIRNAVEHTFSGKLLQKNLIALQRGYDETEVVTLEQHETKAIEKHLFEEHKTACAAPPATPYEAAWSCCDDRYATISTGEWRFEMPVLDRDACRKCGWCAVYCPIGCIRQNEAGYYVPDFKYCKGCGVCANECPADAIKMVIEEGK